MTVAARPDVMTTEQLLELPEDGRERWLILGELREGGMTRRSYAHSRTEAKITYLLYKWADARPGPRGVILSGDAGIRLRRNPDTFVGIDLVYMSPDVASSPLETRALDAVPILAVEILSPSDKQKHILEKVQSYLDAGVALVWVLEPRFRTVTVYRPDAQPQLFNITHTVSGEPHLPGLNVLVKEIFEI